MSLGRPSLVLVSGKTAYGHMSLHRRDPHHAGSACAVSSVTECRQRCPSRPIPRPPFQARDCGPVNLGMGGIITCMPPESLWPEAPSDADEDTHPAPPARTVLKGSYEDSASRHSKPLPSTNKIPPSTRLTDPGDVPYPEKVTEGAQASAPVSQRQSRRSPLLPVLLFPGRESDMVGSVRN